MKIEWQKLSAEIEQQKTLMFGVGGGLLNGHSKSGCTFGVSRLSQKGQMFEGFDRTDYLVSGKSPAQGSNGHCI